MRDVNTPLKKAYFTALAATGEKVYYSQAPDGITGNYIVYSSLNGSPQAMKSGDTVIVNIQVSIYTEANKYNSGDSADAIAEKVYQAIYPFQSFVLPLEAGFQMVSTEFVSDSATSWTLKNQIVAVDRVITFRHKIYIREAVETPVENSLQWAFVPENTDINNASFSNLIGYNLGNIVIPVEANSQNKKLIVRYPVSGSNYNTWYNTPFNNGSLPDSVFNAVETVGGWKYISTRTGAIFDTTQNIIFSS